MQNLNISQFNIRLAVVALIALSAISAFAISVAFSPQNGASADGDTNSEKVKNAVSALETAVANPDLQIEVLQTAVAVVDDVTYDHDGDDPDNNDLKEDGTTATEKRSVVGMVTINNAQHNPTNSDSLATVTVSVDVALGSEHLGYLLTDDENTNAAGLGAAREDETAAFTAIETALNTIKGSTSIQLPGDNVTVTPIAGNTLAADIEKIRTDILDTNRAAKNFNAETTYNSIKTAVYVAFALEDDATFHSEEDLLAQSSDVLPQLYTPAVLDNQGNVGTAASGTLVVLETARNNERAALQAARAILTQVQKALNDVQLVHTLNGTTLLTVYPGNYTKADAEADLKKAKDAVAAALDSDEELTAFDELDALTKLLTDIAGTPTGVLKARIDAINSDLLKNNVDDLDAITDQGEDGNRPDRIDALTDDVTDHIISALTALKNLDGKAAQMTAIQELIDLLTNVDDVVTTTGAPDDVIDNLTQADADRLKAALDAFDALTGALEDRYVDTNPTVAANQVTEHRKDLNDLANGDFSDSQGQSLYNSVDSARSNINTNIDRDAASTATARKLFDALNKDGVLGSALATAPASGIDEITPAEFAAAIGVDIATDGSNAASTSDLHNTMTKFLAIEAAIDGVTGANVGSFNTFEGGLQNAFDNQNSPTDNMAKANTLAKGYRSSTLEFDAHAAMAALLDALEDAGNASGDGIDPAVNTAREALIIVYDQVAHYDADTQARVTASYNALIRDGSTSHQFAQQAALAVVLKAIKDKTGAATLATDIQNALKTQSPDEKKAQAKIAEIKAGIFNAIIVSGGDKVKLDVNVYGVQGIMDQKLADDVTFDWGDASSDTGPSITYTAPTAPGSYDVTASLELNECYHADADTQMEKCSATFTVKVRRPSPVQPQDEAPVNPATVPSILTDSSGNQYEVFTPVEGGTFDNGEGYWITAQSGDVPNGEAIGVRMSDDGSASNLGMTHQRYTLGGNMYGIHVVDAAGSSISSYVLDDPAQVCLPLPAALSSNISKVALVAMNADGTLTILSSSVKLGSSGTSVCGNISTLPASVAVGHVGSPAAIPTATPEPTPVPPPTGATAPTNTNGILIWAILFGLALTGAGTTLTIARRRGF